VSPSPVEELAKLADMLERCLLTREEFDLMKAKIIGLPTIRRFLYRRPVPFRTVRDLGLVNARCPC
jgi:hypothetical protein